MALYTTHWPNCGSCLASGGPYAAIASLTNITREFRVKWISQCRIWRALPLLGGHQGAIRRSSWGIVILLGGWTLNVEHGGDSGIQNHLRDLACLYSISRCDTSNPMTWLKEVTKFLTSLCNMFQHMIWLPPQLCQCQGLIFASSSWNKSPKFPEAHLRISKESRSRKPPGRDSLLFTVAKGVFAYTYES